MENNIAESGVDTSENIVDDTNKINDTEKRTKENQTGKSVVNKSKENIFILGDSYCKSYSRLGSNKNSATNRKLT